VNFDQTMFGQTSRNVFAACLPRCVFVQHDDDESMPVELFARLKGCVVNGQVFHPANEVEGVSAVFALAKAIPDVFSVSTRNWVFIGAFVDGAGTGQAMAGAFEGAEQFVMLQHLFHGDPGTDVPDQRMVSFLWAWEFLFFKVQSAVRKPNRVQWTMIPCHPPHPQIPTEADTMGPGQPFGLKLWFRESI
jgi:hypothetical protein